MSNASVGPQEPQNDAARTRSAVTDAGARMGERAYAEIRDRMLRGEFLPGAWLREEELAADVGVSRTPVREALRRLQAEGLVEFAANRRARVAKVSERDLNEIFSLRALLEGFGARLAATRITAEQLAELERLAARMEQEIASDALPQRLAPTHRSFHLLVASAAGNKRLETVIGNVTQVAWLQHTLERYGPDYTRRSIAQHREIILALRSGNVQWASAIMQAHVLGARHTFDTEG